MGTGIRDAGDAVLTSLTGALTMLMGAIPRIIGFIVIVAIGWVIASLLARGIVALLRAVKFEHLSLRSGFTDLTRKMGIRSDSSGFIAMLAKWFVRLITLVVAFDALGVPAVSGILRQLLLWLPDLAVAVVILLIAGVVGNALGSLVRGATAKAGIAKPNVLAAIVRFAVLAFGVLVALNQIGVASSLVNILFVAVVGAAALALGLAFGLGGRDVAAQIVGDWYTAAQRTMPSLTAQVDEAYARRQIAQRGTWSGIERRQGADPKYHGAERRHGLA
jgi:Conserved TM helix